MAELVRLCWVCLVGLLDSFDAFCKEGRFATRSEAIRQLLHEKLTLTAWETDSTNVAASLTLVYDHHKTKLTDKMLEIQHAHAEQVIATLHVHLDHDLCMEVIALRGKAAALQHLASELTGLKGIRQAQLVVARALGDNEQDDSHHHHHAK